MSRSPLETDPRFWVLSEALASYAADEDDPPLSRTGYVQAAVAVVLRPRGEELDLLLIKRSRSDRDPWSGHMALPGGRRDEDDENLLRTAIRETFEETAVDLDRGGRTLGRLDVVAPVSPLLPRLTISPFVFGVLAEVQANVASHEIQAVHWVPLEVLRAPGTAGTVEIPLPGGARSFPCFHVAGEVVWGLTHRILSQFLEVYADREAGGGGTGATAP